MLPIPAHARRLNRRLERNNKRNDHGLDHDAQSTLEECQMPVCTTITEWIREEVSKPIEEWEERTKEKCKKRKWYDPRKWLCYLAVYFVKVIRWIVVTVVRAVVSTVCRLIVAVLGLIWDILRFIGLLL